MVSPYEATPRVRRPPVGREHVLSTPFAGGAWIRSLERSGQPDSAQAVAQINAMQVLDIVQMPAQRADEAIGEDRNAILGTLAVRPCSREVESSKFHATNKRQTVIDDRNDMRDHNRVMHGRFIRFNSGLIRQLATDVLDQLGVEERRAIDAICFRMKGVDQLLDEAYLVSRMFSDPSFQANRATKAKELIDSLNDAIVNLGILIQMCDQFSQRKFDALLEAQHVVAIRGVTMRPNHAVNADAHRRRFAPWWAPVTLVR